MCWAQNVSITQEAKCFNTPMFYTTDTNFYNSSVKIGLVFYENIAPSFTVPCYWH